jgi:methylenetetrahydrofolate reductase (NADPH)
MEVATLYQDRRNWPVLSAETFPTENWRPIDPILKAVEELLPHGIKVVTTTWGALGSARAGTPAITRIIHERFKIPTVVHLTIQGKTLPDVEGILRNLHLEGIHNILALGGDPPAGRKDMIPAELRHRYAADLVAQIMNMNEGRWFGPNFDFKKEGVKTRFGIGVAGFPEIHPDEYRGEEGFERCMARYIEKLKIKIAAGGQYIVCQMLFDAGFYLRFREAVEKAGITVPVVAGVFPFSSWDQISRFVGDELRISFPTEVQKALCNASKEDQARIAEDHTVDLTQQLLDAGAPGVHFYCMNQSGPTSRVLQRLRL